MNLDEIFKKYEPYFYSKEFSIVLHDYPSIIKNLKRLKDVPYDLIQTSEKSYTDFKKESRHIYKVIKYLLEHYPPRVQDKIGHAFFSLKNIKLYAITPMVDRSKVNVYKKFINKVSNDIFMYGDKHKYKNVVKTVLRLINFILDRSDTTVFNGVMVWFSKVFYSDGYPAISPLISEYISNYYEGIMISLEASMEHYNKVVNKNYDSKLSIIILPKNTLMFKGVKYGHKCRLQKRETNYFLGFNPLLAFIYSQKKEDPDADTNEMTLKQHCDKNFGYIGVFAPNRDLKLMNIKNYEIMKKLYDKVIEEKNDKILEALKFSYPINDDEKSVGRYSEYTNDAIFSKYLCTQGYDGYFGPTFGGFPPEVMICDSDYLKNIACVQSKKIINYCRGTIYDLQTIVIEGVSSNSDNINRNIEIGSGYPVMLSKWSSEMIFKFINDNRLSNFGDINRNILEIYQNTNIIEKMDISQLIELYKFLFNKSPTMMQKRNKNFLKSNIKRQLPIYYIWNIEKYIK